MRIPGRFLVAGFLPLLCCASAEVERKAPSPTPSQAAPAVAHSTAASSASASTATAAGGATHELGTPPPAPVHDVVEKNFGIETHDPYRWMEQQGPELTAWLKAQNDVTRTVLDKLPGRVALLERITALSNSGARTFGQQRMGKRWFYFKLENGSEDKKLFTRVGLDGRETLLVDPTVLGKSDAHVALDWFVASWDGKYVAYGISAGGSENSTLHVVESATGKVLPDAIDRSQYAAVSWRPDSRSFFHLRLQKVAANAPQTDVYRFTKLYLHHLGENPDTEKPLFGAGVVPGVDLGEFDIPAIQVSPASPWALGIAYHGVQLEQDIWVAKASDVPKGKARWTRVASVGDAVTNLDFRGDEVLLLTHKGAPRFRIVKTSLKKPDMAHAQEFMPQQKGVITALGFARDGVYVQVLEGGPSRLLRASFAGGAATELKLPFSASIAGLSINPLLPGATFSAQGYTHSMQVLLADSTTVKDTGLSPPSSLDTTGYEVLEERAKSADGTEVPCTVVAKKGLAHDSSHLALIDGYGALGISAEPYFNPTLFAWLERDAVFVESHPRGGGDFGEEWHNAGRKETKNHTVEDFVACARMLVAEKWSAPKYISGTGTSAGGITIGGAITQEPQLFAAALDRVGATNMTRFETTPGGPTTAPEFGTATTAEGYQALYGMDAYLHIKDGTKYPAVLVETGVNDPRVPDWMPAKMAARLQAATASGKPVLLRVDFDAGHGNGSTRTQDDLQTTDEYSFLFWQLGDAQFQPPAQTAR
jgi:prolyl oligopeptidase